MFNSIVPPLKGRYRCTCITTSHRCRINVHKYRKKELKKGETWGRSPWCWICCLTHLCRREQREKHSGLRCSTSSGESIYCFFFIYSHQKRLSLVLEQNRSCGCITRLCISILADMQMYPWRVNLMHLSSLSPSLCLCLPVSLSLSLSFNEQPKVSTPDHHQAVLVNIARASPAPTSVTRGLRYYKYNI